MRPRKSQPVKELAYRFGEVLFTLILATGLLFPAIAYCQEQSLIDEAIPEGLANVALGKPTWQTSTYGKSVSSLAVDGNTSGDYKDGSLAITLPFSNTWWEVDLGAVYLIKEVRIWNRTDCCPNRLDNFLLQISETPFSSDEALANATSHQGGTTDRLNKIEMADPAAGRYVRISLDGEYMSFAEVEVLAEELSSPVSPGQIEPPAYFSDPLQNLAPPDGLTNVALGKVTQQSSLYAKAESSRAVDGNTSGNYHDGSLTHTLADGPQWWEVDLGSNYAIEEIRIWNRTDCCPERLDNFLLEIADAPLLAEVGDANSTIVQGEKAEQLNEIKMDEPVHGRHVRISIENKNLSLAEVQVFGTKLENQPLEINPSGNFFLNENKAMQISASGGDGQYTFGFLLNTSGGSIDPATGEYFPGPLSSEFLSPTRKYQVNTYGEDIYLPWAAPGDGIMVTDGQGSKTSCGVLHMWSERALLWKNMLEIDDPELQDNVKAELVKTLSERPDAVENIEIQKVIAHFSAELSDWERFNNAAEIIYASDNQDSSAMFLIGGRFKGYLEGIAEGTIDPMDCLTAVKYFKRAIEIDPGFSMARIFLVSTLANHCGPAEKTEAPKVFCEGIPYGLLDDLPIVIPNIPQSGPDDMRTQCEQQGY